MKLDTVTGKIYCMKVFYKKFFALPYFANC